MIIWHSDGEYHILLHMLLYKETSLPMISTDVWLILLLQYRAKQEGPETLDCSPKK
jgi:hypothetical protein